MRLKSSVELLINENGNVIGNEIVVKKPVLKKLQMKRRRRKTQDHQHQKNKMFGTENCIEIKFVQIL